VLLENLFHRALARSFALPLRTALPPALLSLLPTPPSATAHREAALAVLDADERKASGFDALCAALKASAAVGADAANSDLAQAGQEAGEMLS
jgi:hypothetical protein